MLFDVSNKSHICVDLSTRRCSKTCVQCRTPIIKLLWLGGGGGSHQLTRPSEKSVQNEHTTAQLQVQNRLCSSDTRVDHPSLIYLLKKVYSEESHNRDDSPTRRAYCDFLHTSVDPVNPIPRHLIALPVSGASYTKHVLPASERIPFVG